MQRRDFCKLLALTAASKALPSRAEITPSGQSEVPEGFTHQTQDYAEFCAMPPEKRVFYKVTDQRVSWKQQTDALVVELPKLHKPAVDYAAVLRVTLA